MGSWWDQIHADWNRVPDDGSLLGNLTHSGGPGSTDQGLDEDIDATITLFSSSDLAQWDEKRAVEWIERAITPFSVLGIKPTVCTNKAALRARFRKLSLLVHPDKSTHPKAAECFRQLADAMDALDGEEKQRALLKKLFPLQAKSLPPDPNAAKAAPKDPKISDPAADTAERAMSNLTGLELEALAKGVPTQEEVKNPNLARVDEQWRKRTFTSNHSQSAQDGAQADVIETWGKKPKQAEYIASQRSAMAEMALFGKTDPNELWQTRGKEALAQAGWEYRQSRSSGKWYFAHPASGRTVLAAEKSLGGTTDGEQLPKGWEKRESRRQPGVFYYINLETGERKTERPELPGPVGPPGVVSFAMKSSRNKLLNN